MQIGDYEVEINSARVGDGWQAEGILPDGKRIVSAPCSSREDAEDDVKQQAEARLYPQRNYDVNRPFESMSTLEEKNRWLKGAVNPKHKGYCTPMSKSTCTPRRKAFARRAKEGFSDESVTDVADRLLELVDNVNIHERKLSYQARKKLPAGDFVFPKGKRYPIEDPNHARNALARVSQHGTPAEKAKVRSAVHRKYPEIGETDEAIVMRQADGLLEFATPDTIEAERVSPIPPRYELGGRGETRGVTHDAPECPHCGGVGRPIGSKYGLDYYYCNQCRNDFTKVPTGSSRSLTPAKAAFYPSDGGSGGGGGGVTSV